LLDVRNALQHFLDAVLLERAHAVFQLRGEHRRHAGVLLHVLLDAISADQKLVQSHAPLIAGPRAGIAASRSIQQDLALLVAEFLGPRRPQLLPLAGAVGLPDRGDEELLRVLVEQKVDLFVGRRVRLLALAQPLREALREYPEQRIGEIERVHAHVQQTHDRFRGAVRVQGRENEVAGERGFDARGHCLLVAHLAHHDDVGIGAQESFHDHGEIEARLAVHLHLAQTLLRDLDRILGRPDLRVGLVEVTHHRMERRRLARAGRPHTKKRP